MCGSRVPLSEVKRKINFTFLVQQGKSNWQRISLNMHAIYERLLYF